MRFFLIYKNNYSEVTDGKSDYNNDNNMFINYLIKTFMLERWYIYSNTYLYTTPRSLCGILNGVALDVMVDVWQSVRSRKRLVESVKGYVLSPVWRCVELKLWLVCQSGGVGDEGIAMRLFNQHGLWRLVTINYVFSEKYCKVEGKIIVGEC